MGLLVFMRNLLLALCLFLVLGFLYYSAWKLHLLRWEDSKYDKLGFLLNLDSKLPPELASKYANFSEGVCKPGYASALMTVIFPKFLKPAPMFLDDSFRKWARIRDFVPPFGIKGQDNLIKAILSATKDYRLTPALDRAIGWPCNLLLSHSVTAEAGETKQAPFCRVLIKSPGCPDVMCTSDVKNPGKAQDSPYLHRVHLKEAICT